MTTRMIRVKEITDRLTVLREAGWNNPAEYLPLERELYEVITNRVSAVTPHPDAAIWAERAAGRRAGLYR